MYKSIVEGKGGISAKVVAASTCNDVKLTTLELNYPRFIHAEFMTHRQFSRNASSSRAIPVDTMLSQVHDNPATPIHWGKNEKGMQARSALKGHKLSRAQYKWKQAAQGAAGIAEELSKHQGLHKQVTNRILEPFQFIKVVVTATEWDNFFNLRLHKDAQPEIEELARCMKEAMNNSTIQVLTEGEWHLPYIDKATVYEAYTDNTLAKASVARCARVSYLNHDKTTCSIPDDSRLHDMLFIAGHMSPFEHVATPMLYVNQYEYEERKDKEEDWEIGTTHMDKDG